MALLAFAADGRTGRAGRQGQLGRKGGAPRPTAASQLASRSEASFEDSNTCSHRLPDGLVKADEAVKSR